MVGTGAGVALLPSGVTFGVVDCADPMTMTDTPHRKRRQKHKQNQKHKHKHKHKKELKGK
jgi:hypothetical protein